MTHFNLHLGRWQTATLVSLLFIGVAHAQSNAGAQKSKKESSQTSKEENNRNVMLNAASANGPREIQIGLPSADVNVLENGLPVTYATNPHSVNTIWRGDASLSHQGLLKISETAITTGNIGYAVNSFTRLGQEGVNGLLNYKTNHFGLQEISLNLNGSLGQGWYYSGNIYQDFDPGTFKIKSSQYQDRTQIYKAAITKRNAVNYKNDFALGTWAPLSLCNGTTYHLDIFVDKCSVEIFVDGGRIAMTNLVFPTAPYTSARLYTVGGQATVNHMTVNRLSL